MGFDLEVSLIAKTDSGSRVIQKATIRNSGVLYTRWRDDQSNKWSSWCKIYSENSKPTANDVGALPISGGTLTGPLSISDNSKNIKLGTGGLDVFIQNSASGFR